MSLYNIFLFFVNTFPAYISKKFQKKLHITFSSVYDVADFASPDKGFATAYMPQHRSIGTRPRLAKRGGALAREYIPLRHGGYAQTYSQGFSF
jgi:hypothetical protein